MYDQMSFAFIVDDDEYNTKEHLRTIRHIAKLYDVSAVSIPANDGTEISARSWCDGVIAELTEEFRKAEEIERKKQKIRILTEV